MLKRLLGLKRALQRPDPALPAGERTYAIGDIHGRSDLLDDLLARIDADERNRGGAPGLLVFLGDYIDRGPDSRGVIDRLIALAACGRPALFLMGNHEEVLLQTASGDRRAAALFDRIGGRETLLSYGVAADAYDEADLGSLAAMVTAHVPASHLAWLGRLASSHRSGDYLFVHAGIRPGVAIEAQSDSDLRWIRDPFLSDPGDHGMMIVHGHSITAEIDEQPNRIGIDTGGYASGRLTALGLEGGARWFLQT